MSPQEQIDSLKSALASGVKTVQMGNKLITYRTLEEIQSTLRMLETANAQKRSAFGVVRVSHEKGI